MLQNRVFYFIFVLAYLVSCTKKEIGSETQRQEFISQSKDNFSLTDCADSTPIKPPVDILFLWDNSASQFFITNETKALLNNTVNQVSSRFDYHIMIAPLIPLQNSGNPVQYVIAADQSSLNLPSNQSYMLVDSEDLGSRLNSIGNLPTGGGSQESGYNRTVELLQNNRSNNIFRNNSTVIVVLMSNGNENADLVNGIPDPTIILQSLDNTFNNLQAIRNSLGSTDFRFLSLVAHKFGNHNCQPEFIDGNRYRALSKKVYEEIMPPGQRPTDQANNPNPDSYSICNNSFTSLFNSIESTINEIIVEHVYNYWPYATTTAPAFDPGSLTVTKSTGVSIPECTTPPNCNGWVDRGLQINRNTRILPSPGEPFTGYMIQLYGSAQVTFPECMTVKTTSPSDFFAYIVMNKIPDLSTIQLTIDGKSISQSTTNGWEYIGFRQDQNIKVQSPTQPNQPGIPAVTQTGYFLRLHGSAIFSNSVAVSLFFKPATL